MCDLGNRVGLDLGGFMKAAALYGFMRFLPRLMGIHLSKATIKAQIEDLLVELWPRESDAELIRIGSPGDGGYLIPNLLNGIQVCISPGIGSTSEFERQLASDFKIHSVLIDPIRSPVNLEIDKHTFIKKYLGVNRSSDYISLNDVIQKFCFTPREAILQMDIEGAEYANLMDVQSELLSKFRILVIEFHNVHYWFSKPFFESTVKPIFEKLLNSFFVVHIHSNNISFYNSLNKYKIPNTFEVTFLNRESSTIGNLVHTLPNSLDIKNSKLKSDISFPKVIKR